MMRSTTGATAIALLLCSTTGGRAFTATAPIGSRGTFAGPAHHAPVNTSPACRLSNRGGRRSRKTTRATSLRMYVGAPTKADFYEVLGVSRDAGVAEIKRAYRNLAKRYHPDANIHKGRNTSEKFKEICEAYEVLSDDDARSKYDGDSAAARNHHAADGFDPFFRGFRGNHPGAGRGAAGSSRGGAGVGVGTGSGSSGRVASEAWKDFNGVGVGAAGRGAAGARATGSGAGSRRGTSAAWNGAGSGAAAAGASVRGPHASPMMGNDVRLDLEVDFETAAAGGDQTVHVTHLETCATCDGDEAAPGTAVKTCRACNGDGGSVQVTRTHLGTIQSQQECQACGGSGRVVEEYCGMCSGQGRMAKTKAITVTIPPGVKNGSMLRVHGEGDCGPNGGPAGDLYIFITVKLDGNFRSEGSDVHSDVTIGYLDAILGSTVNVPLIGGEEVTIVIPPGTKPGTIMRLQGNGAPIRGDANNRGDHFVTINVDIPSELSREEEELLSRLKDLNLNGGSDNENTETSGLGGFFRNAFS